MEYNKVKKTLPKVEFESGIDAYIMDKYYTDYKVVGRGIYRNHTVFPLCPTLASLFLIKEPKNVPTILAMIFKKLGYSKKDTITILFDEHRTDDMGCDVRYTVNGKTNQLYFKELYLSEGGRDAFSFRLVTKGYEPLGYYCKITETVIPVEFHSPLSRQVLSVRSGMTGGNIHFDSSMTIVQSVDFFPKEINYKLDDRHVLQEYINGEAGAFTFRYSVDFELESHDIPSYAFSLKVRLKENPNNRYNLSYYRPDNEEELISYLNGLSCPIDVGEVYKRICEISFGNDMSKYYMLELNVFLRKYSYIYREYSRTIIDQLTFRNGILESFGMSLDKNNKLIDLGSSIEDGISLKVSFINNRVQYIGLNDRDWHFHSTIPQWVEEDAFSGDPRTKEIIALLKKKAKALQSKVSADLSTGNSSNPFVKNGALGTEEQENKVVFDSCSNFETNEPVEEEHKLKGPKLVKKP